jgi:two-component system response regulator AlgR
MPGMDGIETAKHLHKLETAPAVVFTTAYDEYAVEAFEARAVGYVLKPVRRSRLLVALQQASRLTANTLLEVASQAKIDTTREHVCVHAQGELKLIKVADIVSFRAEQKYVTVYHSGGQDLIDESIKALATEFDANFVRIHRNALVAVAQIDRIDKTGDGRSRVLLRERSQLDGNELIISRRHVAELRRRLKGN